MAAKREAHEGIINRIKADPKLLTMFPQKGKRNPEDKMQCPLCIFGTSNFGEMMLHNKK